MNRLEPLPLDSLAELQDTFNSFKERMGFIANSGLIMARRPKILDALGQLAVAVFDKEESTVPYSLKSCMGQIASLTRVVSTVRPTLLITHWSPASMRRS